MDSVNEIRWRQYFEHYDRLYNSLKAYSNESFQSELEKIGFIHHYEMVIEHAKKVIYSYLEAKNVAETDYRKAIVKMEELGKIENRRTWFKIENRKNLVFYLHNEGVLDELLADINDEYLHELEQFYNRLKEEV